MAKAMETPLNAGSRQAFGGVLVSQGQGFYVTLELLALVWGTSKSMDEVLPSVSEHPVVEIRRRSHDFARRWMNGLEEDIRRTDDNYERDTDSSHVKGKDSERVLRSLHRGLRSRPRFHQISPEHYPQQSIARQHYRVHVRHHV